jgi:hypothetical protein
MLQRLSPGLFSTIVCRKLLGGWVPNLGLNICLMGL